MLDLLIKNALVFDGSGAEPAIKDVATQQGKIRSVGHRFSEAATRVIDADGLALMPGIIDSHTHFDAQVTWDPYVRPSPALGVTTAVIGNCGFTIAPCRPADRDLIMRNLTQVEGMSLDVLRQGIDWGFETFPQYLAQLRRRGSAVNIAAYVGTFLGAHLRDGQRCVEARRDRCRNRADAADGARGHALGCGGLRQQHEPGS